MTTTEIERPTAPPPPAAMAQLINGGVWITQAIYVAAKLRVADQLTDGPRTINEIAAAVSAHPESLYRVLRALASIGIFAEDAGGSFALTPMAETLRTDLPGSLHGMALLWGEPFHWNAWSKFVDGVRRGETPLELYYGMPLFQYMTANPDHFQIFDDAMTGFSGFEAAAVAGGYDFSAFGTLADLGGGHGFLIAEILRANPGLRGILFDLPPVVGGAGSLIDQAGVRDRCEIAGGSFFEQVPQADAYILKNIVHDFSDDQVVALLKKIRQSIAPDGKLLVVQEALPEGNAPSVGKLMDMQMLFIGGKERTEAEYRKLYAAAGFELRRVLPTQSPLHIIEGVPV